MPQSLAGVTHCNSPRYRKSVKYQIPPDRPAPLTQPASLWPPSLPSINSLLLPPSSSACPPPRFFALPHSLLVSCCCCSSPRVLGKPKTFHPGPVSHSSFFSIFPPSIIDALSKQWIARLVSRLSAPRSLLSHPPIHPISGSQRPIAPKRARQSQRKPGASTGGARGYELRLVSGRLRASF